MTTFKSSVDGYGIKPTARIVKTSTVLCLKPKVIGVLITACVVWLSVSNCLKIYSEFLLHKAYCMRSYGMYAFKVCGVMTTRASTMWRSVGMTDRRRSTENARASHIVQGILSLIIKPAVVMRCGRLYKPIYKEPDAVMRCIRLLNMGLCPERFNASKNKKPQRRINYGKEQRSIGKNGWHRTG